MPMINKNGVYFLFNSNGVLLSISHHDRYRHKIVIPHKFKTGETITAIDQTFDIHGEVHTIYISDGITEVHEGAFKFSHVKVVRWPSTCSKIPENCFKYSSVRKITNIDHVEDVGKCAFYSCEFMSKFKWPSKCPVIPKGCFSQSFLMSINNIEHVSQINRGAFCKTLLKKFVWPSNCPVIPPCCFQASLLEDILNTDNVKQIEGDAFCATHIQKFTWPSACKIIPEDCFTNTPLNELYNIQDVEEIGSRALGYTNLCRFEWPSSCKNIPEYCFKGSKLKEITNIDSVETIGDYAFAGCCFETFVVPDKVSVIPRCFMEENMFLRTVKFGDNVCEIGECAFSGNKSIEELDLSNLMNYVSVGKYAFEDVPTESVVLPFYMLPEGLDMAFDRQGN